MNDKHDLVVEASRDVVARTRGIVSLWRGALVGCLLLLFPVGSAFAATSVSQLRRKCTRQEKAGLYLQAASCYARLYQKTKKARALFKAAETHHLAADNQRSPYHEIVLRKRAIYFYSLYVKLNPGASGRTNKVLREQRRYLRRALRTGYGVVWVDGDAPDGRAPKPTYKLYSKRRLVGAGPLPMREELRPGRYLLVIRRKGHHPQRIKLVVRKNETLYHRQRLRSRGQPRPDTIERRSRAAAPGNGDRIGPAASSAGSGGGGGSVPKVVPYVVLGASLLFCVIGGALAGVAATNHAAIRDEPQAPEATDLFNQIGGLTVGSTILVSVGVAGGITSGILFYFAYER